jgi:hypothetical protein
VSHRKFLYHARINRQLTLQQIALRTALSPSVLRHIDEGRFEMLPSGVYARSYVRAFATAVGLDPEEALSQVEPYLPGLPDAIAAMHESQALTAWERLTRRLAPARQKLAETSASLRPVVKRAPGGPDGTAPRRKQDLTPWAAAAIDATLLVAVDAFLVMLISWSSGIALDVLLRETGLALALFCAIPVLLYFLFFGGIAGSTLGQYVCHLIVQKTGRPLRLPDILRRTFGH